MMKTSAHVTSFEAVERAFSRQAPTYDEHDAANPILTHWRQKVYAHVEQFIQPNSSILELNAGTGIDALYFAKQGHNVYATDQSSGMVREIEAKAISHKLEGHLSFAQCSYDNLDIDPGKKFDYIFSNFGGLNCIRDLTRVTRQFSRLLQPGGYVTLVIMPPLSPWEWGMVLKGNFSRAFRRVSKNGTRSHLEGEYFTTYYHSVGSISDAMGKEFKLVKAESLGLLSPPPHKGNFARRYARLYNFLMKLDRTGGMFPFNRWGDHVMVTYELKTNR